MTKKVTKPDLLITGERAYLPLWVPESLNPPPRGLDTPLMPGNRRLHTRQRRKRDYGHPERIRGGRGKAHGPALGPALPNGRMILRRGTTTTTDPFPGKANRPRVFHLGLLRAMGILNLYCVSSEKPFEFSNGYRNVAGGAAYRDLPVRYLLT